MEVFRLLEHSLPFLLLATGLLGLMVGSFLNVVIHRLPVIMERAWVREIHSFQDSETPPDSAGPAYNLVVPASTCPQCGHRITALENIPVLSYVFPVSYTHLTLPTSSVMGGGGGGGCEE